VWPRRLLSATSTQGLSVVVRRRASPPGSRHDCTESRHGSPLQSLPRLGSPCQISQPGDGAADERRSRFYGVTARSVRPQRLPQTLPAADGSRDVWSCAVAASDCAGARRPFFGLSFRADGIVLAIGPSRTKTAAASADDVEHAGACLRGFAVLGFDVQVSTLRRAQLGFDQVLVGPREALSTSMICLLCMLLADERCAEKKGSPRDGGRGPAAQSVGEES
jgi:hypothetical protein